jgi:hypothetical protein
MRTTILEPARTATARKMLKVLPVDVERHAHVTGDPSPDRPTNVVYSVEGSDIAPAVNIGDGGPQAILPRQIGRPQTTLPHVALEGGIGRAGMQRTRRGGNWPNLCPAG